MPIRAYFLFLIFLVSILLPGWLPLLFLFPLAFLCLFSQNIESTLLDESY